ncbi:MAG: DUF1566 domain-containing protein [Pseudomonadota bacterium]
MYKLTNLNKLRCSFIVLLSSPVLLYAVELNDTGLGENKYSSEQSDYYFYPKDVADYPGQDPQYGRDAAEQGDVLDKVGGGHAGFDFSESSDCVVDNVTGLVWEAKTDASDDGLQSNKWTFTYVDSNETPLYPVEPKMVTKAKLKKAVPETIHEEIILDSKVLFDYDKSNLRADAKASIDEYIDGFRDKFKHIRSVTVIGHTDGIASQKYNQALSERRARTVANYLEGIEDIPVSEVDAIGKGKLEPIDTNETDEGRANNRRVVINLELDNMPSEPEEEMLGTEMVETKTTTDHASAMSNAKASSSLPEVAVPPICSDEKNSIRCDTESYVTKMNEINLCGYDNWRLPSREELRSIVDYGFSLPAIDKDYFPNSISSAYWTSSRYVNNDFRVWVVDFEHGGDNTHEKHRTLPIRLVRDSKSTDTGSSNTRAINTDAEEDNSFSDFFSPITNLWK